MLSHDLGMRACKKNQHIWTMGNVQASQSACVILTGPNYNS